MVKKRISISRRFLAAASALLSAAFLLPLLPAGQVKAAQTTGVPIAAYSEQEGMGSIQSYLNETPFRDTAEARPGDVIRVTASYYPLCTFEGWYVNGVCKSLAKDYSFTVDADTPMYTVAAKFRQNGEHLKGHAELDISKTSWPNRVCRFAAGSEVKDVAVTTSMAVQGPACMAAFASVSGSDVIARTYNITFTKYGRGDLAELEAPASLVFQIPQELVSYGRRFYLIHVAKGIPTVLEDTDAADETLTFTTEKAGAYALVYSDAAAGLEETLPE